MILGEVKRFLRDDGLIKVSRSLKQASSKGIKAREDLKKILGREPTINEISEKCGISTEDLVCAFDSAREPESIDRTLYEDSEETFSDRLSVSDEEERITDKILIEQMLGKITKKERQIIVLRYFKDKSQQEIADMLGVSQVQVSRREKAVLRLLREKME